jgi:hypothetical protein
MTGLLTTPFGELMRHVRAAGAQERQRVAGIIEAELAEFRVPREVDVLNTPIRDLARHLRQAGEQERERVMATVQDELAEFWPPDAVDANEGVA